MRIRAAVTEQPGGPFVVRGVEIDEPGPGEVLVRLTAAGLCHTDLTAQATWPRQRLPVVLGHEGSGVVEAAGAEVTGLRPGDPVCLTFDSCGSCEQCAAGHPAYCHAAGMLNAFGGRGGRPLSADVPPVHGGFFGQSSFATRALAGARNAIPIPAELPAAVAAPLGCAGQTGAGTVLNRLRPEPGSSLVVLGAGGVGCCALMAAIAAGCEPVIAVDPVPARRALALELGAAAALEPSGDLVAALREHTGGAHHVIDTTGKAAVIEQAVGALRPRGQLALVGIGGEVSFDVMRLMGKGIRVHGVLEGDSDPSRFLPELVELHRQGRFPLEKIITTFPFERIEDAAAAMRDGSVVKPVLTFAPDHG